MGQYLLELCLVDDSMLKFTESLIAVTAVYLANKLFQKDYNCSSNFYTDEEIKSCAMEILVLFQIAINYPLTALRDKFSMAQYHQVSTICLD